MTNLEDQLKDQWIKVVEQYMDTVKWCVDTTNHSGSILGYPAALLLLCTIDAIGHGLLPPILKKNGRPVNTRLDVLMYPPFDPNLNLDNKKIGNLVSWYRNMLAHTGTMSPNVVLEPDVQGDPFGFNNNAPTLIRVPVLYKVVKDAWEGRDKNVFNLPKMNSDPPAQPPLYGFAASGVALPIPASICSASTLTVSPGSWPHSLASAVQRPSRKR